MLSHSSPWCPEHLCTAPRGAGRKWSPSLQHNRHPPSAPLQALFDDASFLWSEPIMVTTKKAATGKGAGGAGSGSMPGGQRGQ